MIIDLPGTWLFPAAILLADNLQRLWSLATSLVCPVPSCSAPQQRLSGLSLSFTEMAEADVERYAQFLVPRLGPGGTLFEKNYDNTQPGPAFCDPRKALARYFSVQRRVRGVCLRGVPRLWSLIPQLRLCHVRKKGKLPGTTIPFTYNLGAVIFSASRMRVRCGHGEYQPAASLRIGIHLVRESRVLHQARLSQHRLGAPDRFRLEGVAPLADLS